VRGEGRKEDMRGAEIQEARRAVEKGGYLCACSLRRLHHSLKWMEGDT
jgi:hypothetical protein